jgi:hypothetical protein
VRTILLGPQRFTVKATTALRSLETEGPVAVINAGWEEREDDTAELDAALDGRARNLRLFHRLGDVLLKDATFAAAASRFRVRHDELTGLYRTRLDHVKEEVYAVSALVPIHPAGVHHSAAYRGLLDAVENVRRTDDWYLRELGLLYAALAEEGRTEATGVIGWHRGEIQAALIGCAAMVLPGGNIRSLMSAIRLFQVDIPAEMPVVAWSAGAMALTDRIVLFHDFGSTAARETELFDFGLGRIKGVVVFPHARRRLRMDDPNRLSILAQRFHDAECVVLDDGTLLDVRDGVRPASARIIGTDGIVHTGDAL